MCLKQRGSSPMPQTLIRSQWVKLFSWGQWVNVYIQPVFDACNVHVTLPYRNSNSYSEYFIKQHVYNCTFTIQSHQYISVQDCRISSTLVLHSNGTWSVQSFKIIWLLRKRSLANNISWDLCLRRVLFGWWCWSGFIKIWKKISSCTT